MSKNVELKVFHWDLKPVSTDNKAHIISKTNRYYSNNHYLNNLLVSTLFSILFRCVNFHITKHYHCLPVFNKNYTPLILSAYKHKLPEKLQKKMTFL